MAKNQSFNISLKLLTAQFNKGIRNVQKQLNTFNSYIKSVFALGTVTAFGRKMVEVGSEFENAMSRVKAVTNASTTEFKLMSNEAKRLGATTKYTATEAANALENLTRNGLSATNATKALGGVLQFAQANAIGLAESADIVTNTMNMFGLSVKDVNRINDVLSSTAANSATDVSLLYEALVNASPAAKTLGFSLEETSSAIGALAQRGIKGADAGTQLRMSLTKMADPKIVKKMNDMGVAIDEQTMKSEGLLGTIKRLKDAELSLTDLVAIFSQRGAVGMQQLINSYEDFEFLLEITKNSAGTTARMFEQGVGSTKQKLDTLKSTYEDFLITLSQKTSGVVNSCISYITHLIRDFQTVGGTIKNLAVVIVPLLGKKITQMFRAAATTAKTFGGTVKAVGLSMKAALGDWIGLAISAIVVAIDALTAKYRELKKAVKDSEQAMRDSETESNKLAGRAEALIAKLGNGKDSLTSVVAELNTLFPDFADAISKAAAEANKTGNYDKLKATLNDIVSLQSKMMANSANRGMYDANLDMGAHKMRTASKSEKEKAGLSSLDSYFKSNKVSKDVQESIYRGILELRIQGASDSAINDYVQTTTGGGASINGVNGFNSNMIKGLYEYIGKGRELNQSFNSNTNDITRKELEVRARELGIEIEEAFTNDDLKNKIAEAEKKAAEDLAKNNAATEAAEEEAKSKKESADKVAKVEEDLQKTISNVTDDLENEFIDSKDALDELTNAYKKAYEDLRELTGASKENNKYFDKYSKLNKKEIGLRGALDKEEISALPKLNNSNLQAQAIAQTSSTLAPSSNTPQALNLDNVGIDSLLDKTNAWYGVLGNAAGSVTSMANAFETLGDSEADWTDKLGAAMGILQGMTGVLETVNMLTKVGTALTAAQVPIEGELATTKTAAAIASLFSGQGEIPILGPALALAGVAALIAALAAAPKFAEGGIVGGNKLHGDMNIARVNSGEMILNGSQQSNLWKMINSNASSGKPSEVEFKIRGKDLVASINNYNKSISKISTTL